MDTQRKRAQLIASSIVLVVVSVPLILGVVPPNDIYGFRIAATLSNRAIWYPANAFMGWALSIAAVISAILMLTLPATVKRWRLLAAYWLPLAGAIVASFVYLNRLV